jgi:hypothetical protein
MNEQEFRERFERAVGAPPLLDRAKLAAAIQNPRKSSSAVALGSIAATLAIIAAGVFTGWRLLTPSRGTAGHPPVSRSSSTPAPTSGNTRLVCGVIPVIVQLESGPPGKLAYGTGFLDTSTGHFTADTSASISGLPGGDFPGTIAKPPQPSHPSFYSWALRRWLPVLASEVSVHRVILPMASSARLGSITRWTELRLGETAASG